nr:DUF6384 family protein [Hyphomonas sediminis]
MDDVLLAMDVVDTLRHREQLVLSELDAGAREEALLVRLKEIYAAQGIDVPEHILKEGVKALEERRFQYEPPKPSLSVSLAKLYISRSRWMAPLVLAVIALGSLGTAWHFGVAVPARQAEQAARIELSETLPEEIDRLHRVVAETALEEEVTLKANALKAEGQGAIAAGDAKSARAARDGLAELQGDLLRVYEVRIVYGPNEARSGVFRIPDDVPGARNYYLIVEAVDPNGRLVDVPITSEEDRRTARVTRWGQRVTEAEFRAVAEDKGDDQIIQNAVIGRKLAGYLSPAYSVETPGGAILEW